MINALVSSFPSEWQTTITVTRGGRTQAGQVTEPEVFTVPNVLVGWTGTGDGADWNEAPSDQATLWLDPGAFEFQHRDLVEIPEGDHPSGRWQVDGRPMAWPMGIEVRLRRRI